MRSNSAGNLLTSSPSDGRLATRCGLEISSCSLSSVYRVAGFFVSHRARSASQIIRLVDSGRLKNSLLILFTSFFSISCGFCHNFIVPELPAMSSFDDTSKYSLFLQFSCRIQFVAFYLFPDDRMILSARIKRKHPDGYPAGV